MTDQTDLKKPEPGSFELQHAGRTTGGTDIIVTSGEEGHVGRIKRLNDELGAMDVENNYAELQAKRQEIISEEVLENAKHRTIMIQVLARQLQEADDLQADRELRRKELEDIMAFRKECREEQKDVKAWREAVAKRQEREVTAMESITCILDAMNQRAIGQ